MGCAVVDMQVFGLATGAGGKLVCLFTRFRDLAVDYNSNDI